MSDIVHTMDQQKPNDSPRVNLAYRPLSPAEVAPGKIASHLLDQGDLFAVPVGRGETLLKAIEHADFPFEAISRIAEAESWRKEINRPLSHIHKWWAQRLGSVFRSIVIAAFSSSGSDVMSRFYEPTRINGKIVFDPFMGSGTTLTEVVKLGGHAIGHDINPVAVFLVRTALAKHDRQAIEEEFQRIDSEVGESIRQYYQCRLPDGASATVLYYFWVKVIGCPNCGEHVDLFANYVFARHAYAARNPIAHSVCPKCGEINKTRYDASSLICQDCQFEFNPQDGPAKGQKAICPGCSHRFSIIQQVKTSSEPPRHRLYAKLVLGPGGKKQYLRATTDDVRLYDEASSELSRGQYSYPSVVINCGYNTNQAIGYNYNQWEKMFNDRQLLCLSILSNRIASIEDDAIRDLFLCLFSGMLEFNNQFTSYKGEGTGAVRHMFAHHVLKPERVPLEANIWGTPKS